MDNAKLIYEELNSKIPGIKVAIGYGSEYDKPKEILERLQTPRKIDRTMRSSSMLLLKELYDEKKWKDHEDQFDFLILSDNVKSTFLNAIKEYPECATPVVKKFINISSNKSLTFGTNVIYMTFVYIESLKRYIKIGLCDYYDTINSMLDYDSLYIPLRLSKKTYIPKSTPEFDEALDFNKKMIDYLTGLIIPDESYPILKHFKTAYNLSYGGDCRTGIAEDPEKISKLINNQKEFLNENYAKLKMFTRSTQGENDEIYITKTIPENWFEILPNVLQENVKQANLHNSDLSTVEDREKIAEIILNYIQKRNKIESMIQPIRGIGSNGPLNCLSYFTRKLTKAHH